MRHGNGELQFWRAQSMDMDLAFSLKSSSMVMLFTAFTAFVFHHWKWWNYCTIIHQAQSMTAFKAYSSSGLDITEIQSMKSNDSKHSKLSPVSSCFRSYSWCCSHLKLVKRCELDHCISLRWQPPSSIWIPYESQAHCCDTRRHWNCTLTVMVPWAWGREAGPPRPWAPRAFHPGGCEGTWAPTPPCYCVFCLKLLLIPESCFRIPMKW